MSIQLKVGNIYKTRKGFSICIYQFDDQEVYPFIGAVSESYASSTKGAKDSIPYTANGFYYEDGYYSIYDLVEDLGPCPSFLKTKEKHKKDLALLQIQNSEW